MTDCVTNGNSLSGSMSTGERCGRLDRGERDLWALLPIEPTRLHVSHVSIVLCRKQIQSDFLSLCLLQHLIN